MKAWLFQVRIKMRRHQARGIRSLPPDLPDLGWRLGTFASCLLILGVWPFHYTGKPKHHEAQGPCFPMDTTHRDHRNTVYISLLREANEKIRDFVFPPKNHEIYRLLMVKFDIKMCTQMGGWSRSVVRHSCEFYPLPLTFGIYEAFPRRQVRIQQLFFHFRDVFGM